MKLIEPSFEIIEQEDGIDGIYRKIEKAARVCYKSEDKMTDDSAKTMVDNLIMRGHGAMLEHGTVYLYVPVYKDDSTANTIFKYLENKYSKVINSNGHEACSANAGDYNAYITTNYRVIRENSWIKDLEEYGSEDCIGHESRITVKFVTSIGIVRELLRHRVFSFANESTRYCNYSKDKFDNEITFIKPSWFSNTSIEQHDFFKSLLGICEAAYLKQIELGKKPEEAREVLPLCTKSELVMTGFVSDWKDLFRLRVDGMSGKPHPDMLKLMTPVKEEFIKRGYV